jgi:hypothetical protein
MESPGEERQETPLEGSVSSRPYRLVSSDVATNDPACTLLDNIESTGTATAGTNSLPCLDLHASAPGICIASAAATVGQ